MHPTRKQEPGGTAVQHPPEPLHEDRLVGGLAHIAVLFSALGLALNIALLVHYRRRPFIAAHLRQALGLQVLSIILSWTVGLYVTVAGLWASFGRVSPGFFFHKSIVTGLAVLLLNGIKIVLAILGAMSAFGGRPYRQPLIGDLLARLGD